jgi:predicted dehydrogenase
MRRMLETGCIGTPLTACLVMQYAGPHLWHPNPDFLFQPGAGPLFDIGPYYLTALAQAFGPVTRVAARGGTAAPTRIIGAGPRAGEEIPVAVATYVAALYDFDSGGVAQATFSFDSPLERTGVIEIAGSEATLVAPDPNGFGGEIRINRGGPEWESVPAPGAGHGRGIGVVDMARAIRAGVAHSADGRLGLHVLDAMLATETSIETATFVEVASRFDPVPTLPADWDPTEATLVR